MIGQASSKYNIQDVSLHQMSVFENNQASKASQSETPLQVLKHLIHLILLKNYCII